MGEAQRSTLMPVAMLSMLHAIPCAPRTGHPRAAVTHYLIWLRRNEANPLRTLVYFLTGRHSSHWFRFRFNVRTAARRSPVSGVGRSLLLTLVVSLYGAGAVDTDGS